MQSAAEELCGDWESVLDRVREKGFVLKYASDDLKRDREIVLVDGDAAARSRKTHAEADDHGRQSDACSRRCLSRAKQRPLEGARGIPFARHPRVGMVSCGLALAELEALRQALHTEPRPC